MYWKCTALQKTLWANFKARKTSPNIPKTPCLATNYSPVLATCPIFPFLGNLDIQSLGSEITGITGAGQLAVLQ